MPMFQEGNRVVALSASQGMQEGAAYLVERIEERPLPFGPFVTYILSDEAGRQFPVINGHLLLRRAAPLGQGPAR